MKHLFLILPTRKLIIESFAKSISPDDYIAFKAEQIAHPDFNSTFDVMSDLRWAEFAFPPEGLNSIADFFKENIDLEANRKGCLLTLEPLQTAYSMIFKKRTEVSTVSWKVCTTMEEAMMWLNYPLSVEELEVVLVDLKEQVESEE